MIDSKYCKQHHKQLYPVAETDGAELQSEVHPGSLETVEVSLPDEAWVPQQADPEFRKFELAKRIAQSLAASNLVPEAYRGRNNDCFVAINMGAELGMEPFQAIQSIAVIDGKPCLFGDGLIGVVRASSLCEWIEESQSEDGKSATCTTQRKGDRKPVTATYSMDDAIAAGINNKFNWKKHPKRMLQMRARAYCLRDAYPDLLKGLGVVEERQDHDDAPPVVTSYELPTEPETPEALVGEIVVTLTEVEKDIRGATSMADLLKAADKAKGLSAIDQKTARLVYSKKRDALQGSVNG
jgi:hypothetical protein